MKTTSRLPRWLWGSVVGIGLVAVSIALFYLLKPNRNVTPPSEEALFSDETKPEDSTLQTSSAEPRHVVKTDSTPTLVLSNGSVEEACGIHEFPSYWDDSEDSDHEDLLLRAFMSEECRKALDIHVGAKNPYLWGRSDVYLRQFAFIEIENPLTFDRIFADPSGDFARVQFTLSRFECLLENGTATNYELKESCNSDALLNYALLNRYCYDGGYSTRNREHYSERPTPEQSRLRWKQDLEAVWVRSKCKEFDSELELTEDRYPDLAKLLSSLANSNSLGVQMLKIERNRLPEIPFSEILPTSYLISTLIEMAARLGDDAAALTNDWPFGERGVRLGRFKELELSSSWGALRWKKEPSQARLLRTFDFLKTVAHKDIEFNWEWLVRHLCEPPFPHAEQDPQTRLTVSKNEYDSSEPKSCRAVINELYTDGNLSDSVVEVIEQFERTAMDLDLYH